MNGKETLVVFVGLLFVAYASYGVGYTRGMGEGYKQCMIHTGNLDWIERTVVRCEDKIDLIGHRLVLDGWRPSNGSVVQHRMKKQAQLGGQK